MAVDNHGIPINVLFFAQSRELLGISQTTMTIPIGMSLAGLEEHLYSIVSKGMYMIPLDPPEIF